MHVNAITKHTIADNDTSLTVETEDGMVPVAIYAELWAPATSTLQLKLTDSGLPGVVEVYKATDDAAITLVDDTWTTIPEVWGRKIAAVGKFRFLFNAAETGGPIVAQIAWAPLGGA